MFQEEILLWQASSRLFFCSAATLGTCTFEGCIFIGSFPFAGPAGVWCLGFCLSVISVSGPLACLPVHSLPH